MSNTAVKQTEVRYGKTYQRKFQTNVGKPITREMIAEALRLLADNILRLNSALETEPDASFEKFKRFEIEGGAWMHAEGETGYISISIQ